MLGSADTGRWAEEFQTMQILTKLQEIWPFLIAAAGMLAATVIFVKNLLSVKKLQLEIANLKEGQQKDSIIKEPSITEIERYGSAIKRWNSTLAIFLSLTSISLMQSFITTSSVESPSQITIENSSLNNDITNGVVVGNAGIKIDSADIIIKELPKISNTDDVQVLDYLKISHGKISDKNLISWYKFSLTEESLVTLTTSNTDSLDTVLYLFQSNDTNKLLQKDDDSGDGNTSSIELPLEAGEYIVGVTSYGSTVGKFDLAIISNEIPEIHIWQGLENEIITQPNAFKIWYKFNATEKGLYALDVGIHSSQITVTDKDHEKTHLVTIAVESIPMSLVALETGSYYITVRVHEKISHNPRIRYLGLSEKVNKQVK